MRWVLQRLRASRARQVVSGLLRAESERAEQTGVEQVLHACGVQRRDEIMQLLLHAGYSCRFRAVRSKSGLSSDNSWAVRFVAPRCAASEALSRPSLPRAEIARVAYSGRVWCVTVEHNDHLVVVQRAQRTIVARDDNRRDVAATATKESFGHVHRASRPLIIGQCLVLDLDETLVHSSFKPIPNADFVISIELEGVIHRVYVRKRPGVDHFMRVVGEKFEVVIFTASLSKYADPLLDILDRNRVVKARLFREACVQHYGNYVKDLSHLGRRMQDILIVDNSPFSYMFQPDNAIAISSWFNDKADRQLYELLPFLDSLMHVDDVAHVLQRRKPAYGSGVGVPPNLLPPGWQPTVQDPDIMNAQQKRGQ